jgi:hypothetical protein
MQMVQECPQCGSDTRCRRREFNEQTWSVLLSWGEVHTESVDQPICDTCYGDLREMLIDRADEFDSALKQPQRPISREMTASKPRSAVAKKASATVQTAKKKVATSKTKKTSRVA